MRLSVGMGLYDSELERSDAERISLEDESGQLKLEDGTGYIVAETE